MIRAIPSNASDNVYCTLLAQSAVHGAMAGYSGFTVGPVNSRHAYIPFYVCSCMLTHPMNLITKPAFTSYFGNLKQSWLHKFILVLVTNIFWTWKSGEFLTLWKLWCSVQKINSFSKCLDIILSFPNLYIMERNSEAFLFFYFACSV